MKGKKQKVDLTEPVKQPLQNMSWSSNVKALFEEIVESNDTMRAVAMPLRITYSILQEAAQRAIELQDEKLVAIFCRLALYEESDPYSKEYDEKKTQDLVTKFYNTQLK